MQFHDFRLIYSDARRRFPNAPRDPSQFYTDCLETALRLQPGRVSIEAAQFYMEREWHRERRPYYLVHPQIIPYLTRLRESVVLAEQIHAPIPHILFRFPESKPTLPFSCGGQSYHLRTALVQDGDAMSNCGRTLTIFMDFGEIWPDGSRAYTMKNLLMKPGLSIEQAIDALPVDDSINIGVAIPYEVVLSAIRIVCMTFLLSAEDFIEPDILSADADKPLTDQIIDRARRRGKIGWHIGRSFTVSPHYRGPCPLALYWTGQGRTKPIYRPRAGCIVHRHKLADIPTGFAGTLTE